MAEDEYAKLKEVWRTPETRPLNYAGFAQLKRIARDMLHDESLRPDVALWIECFRDFRSHTLDDLAHMAIYEIAVLSLRIKGDMHGQEAEIRLFVEYALESFDPDRLMDLACLVSYCTGALLDWQILAAIGGVAMSYRAGRGFDPRRDPRQKFQLLVERYMREAEHESWPEVPLEEFTRARLRFQMIVNVTTTIKGAGLLCRQKTPNEQAVLDFVRYKMRYFDDDMRHVDILAEAS